MAGEPDDYVTPARFEIQVPPDLEVGAYANFLSVWHSPYEFTLDFAVTQQVEMQEGAGPLGEAVVPARVVARLKISPTLVLDLLQTLSANMARYEVAYGEIRRPMETEGEG